MELSTSSSVVAIDDIRFSVGKCSESKTCPPKKFGSDCDKDCHCGGDECERRTGVCLDKGACQAGSYGMDCTSKATCKLPEVVNATSNCKDVAVDGDVCKVECFPGFYNEGSTNFTCAQAEIGISGADWLESNVEFTCSEIKCQFSDSDLPKDSESKDCRPGTDCYALHSNVYVYYY